VLFVLLFGRPDSLLLPGAGSHPDWPARNMNEHMGLLIVRQKSIVRAALITVGMLLIPLWGVFYGDGWNWDWHGFVVAGAFVFSAALTFELVAKAMSNSAYRFAAGLAVGRLSFSSG
jgi:hypothetical protein